MGGPPPPVRAPSTTAPVRSTPPPQPTPAAAPAKSTHRKQAFNREYEWLSESDR
jgi:hypothetical protein